jgi:ribosomal protein L20
MVYSTFIAGVNKQGLGLNRKMLAEMAIHHPQDFNKIVERVRSGA